MVDQELLSTIAVTLATKTAEGLAAGGRAAFEALARLVRRKFQDPDSASTAVVESGADQAELLRQALTQAVADDSAFEAELLGRWQTLAPHLNASQGDMINSVSGTVTGTVVQARDVHGGISFGGPAPR